MDRETAPVRPGEELNSQNLRLFLQENLGLKNEPIEVSQFPAGSSNLTYLIRVGQSEYVLRRPPFGNRVKSAHDMNREFNVLSKLSKIYGPAPRPLLFCDDEKVVGSQFYLMEKREGLILRGKLPEELKNSPVLQRSLCESFVGNLAALHSLDYEKAGLGELGKPDGYARRQIEGWTKRYFNAKTDDNAELEAAVRWLNSNVPESRPAAAAAALIHNDYKFDNIMLDPNDLTKIVAVLDWEMATVGEPLMDFGTALGYWMSPESGDEMLSMPFNPRILMESVSRRELTEMYAEKSGRDVSDMLFYYVFGTFKVAAIAQQIYFRYARGFTGDTRFARFNVMVKALGKTARLAIEKGKI